MKRMKLFYIFLGTFFVSFGMASAQEPTCEGVDTTHWKIVNTIPIDYACIGGIHIGHLGYPIAFFRHFKKEKNSKCDLLKSMDLEKYNLITFTSSAGGCKQPLVKCSLFDNGTKTTFFKVTITEFGRCKQSRGIVLFFLVLKRVCPNKPKICITRKIIEDKIFLQNR